MKSRTLLAICLFAQSACYAGSFSGLAFHDGVQDSSGKLAFTCDLDDILLPEDGWLPIQLAFYPSREGEGAALGYGWTVPLLDSRVMETSESSFVCISPDGQSHPFDVVRGEKGKFTNKQGWKATVKGGRVEVITPNNTRLNYTNGRLRELRCNDDSLVLTISRESNGLGEVKTKDGKVLLALRETSEGLSMDTANGAYSMSFQDFPIFGKNVIGKPVLIDLKKSVGHIYSKQGQNICRAEFDFRDPNQSALSLNLHDRNLRVPFSSQSLMLIEPLQNGFSQIEYTSPSRLVISRMQNGKKEEVFFNDTSKLHSGWKDSVGRWHEAWGFFDQQGVPRIRKKVLKGQGGDIETYRAHYDANGNILKEIGVKAAAARIDTDKIFSKEGEVIGTLTSEGVVVIKTSK
ncbi:MAG: hypothetical protein L3J39_04590 [Verrucomicrobiales bacterium]|nr:hypothetical protein [Verrucomicrobiales bacterium]